MSQACPYCRAPLDEGEEIKTCETCATPHHADCYAENGGCTVFGCAMAPVDEPKMSVTASELSGRLRASSFVAPMLATPPPPRMRGQTTSIPPPPRGNYFDDGMGAGLLPLRYAPEDATPRGLSFGGYNAAPQVPLSAYIRRRSRLTFILLGVFLGAFGGHNFYAGYTKKAVIQLLLTLLSCLFGGIVSWIWAIVEVCIVKQDDDGIAFI